MLSWTVWKEHLNWLRERVTESALRFPVRAVIVSIATVVVLYLAIDGYRTWPAPWDWLQGGSNGRIIVNSPTVYTRQRLVNDRLSQTTWLQDQLKAADSNFRSVDRLYRNNLQQTWGAQISQGADKPDPKSDQGTENSDNKKQDQTQRQEPASIQPLSVETTTPAEFRAKNLYRDEVRAEITQTQLDDRHDISGNTIYRLAFDATIIPGSRRDAVAGVRITLSHKALKTAVESAAPTPDRPAFDLLYSEDYVNLYAEWLRYMQGQMIASIENISAGIGAGKADPKTRQRLAQFLLLTICNYKLQIENASAEDFACDPELVDQGDKVEAATNQRAALRFVDERMKVHSKIRDDKSRNDFEGFMESLLSEEAAYKDVKEADKAGKESEKKRRVQRYYQQARLFCRRGNLSEFDLGNVFSELQPLFTPKALQPPMFNSRMECPYFYELPGERLKLGVLIYSELIRLKQSMQDKGSPVSDIEKELERNQICPLDNKDPEGQALCWYAEQQAAARCFAVDFIKSNLNRFPTRWNNIDYFLKLESAGRETGECNLLVSETINPRKTIEELKYILNENTEAFAYSVAPKNFTENVSTASETRDRFELLARFGNSSATNVSAIASQMLQRSIQMQAVLAHPVVVGFSSGTKMPEVIPHPHTSANDRFYHPLNAGRKTTAIREVEVGWVIAPRMRERGLEQIDNQYALTTVVSIPSWWRSIELDVETCWLPRERLTAIGSSQEGTPTICEGVEKSAAKKAVVRLPGAIGELSRKLGFDVLQEPALYLSDNPVQVLEIGQPGSLLLRGARLWRSTEVTLGSQKASNIVVLPNMDGIVAGFKCVLPQLSNGGYDGRPIPINAFVWTSEGVTTGAPVLLLWPGQNASPPTPGSAPIPPPIDRPPTKDAIPAVPSASNQQLLADAAAPVHENSPASATASPVAPRTSNTLVVSANSTPNSKSNNQPGRDTDILKSGQIKWCPELFPKSSNP